MGERKVLNKHYPQDFDPSKIPRRKQPKNQQIKVRMMLPINIRCATCGTYISKGTKFNSRKEDVVGETYLGLQIFRFYFKCTRCSAEITFKTDPQNSDYTVESGAIRNFEPWREEDEAADKEKRKRDAEEMGDAMKALENRAMDSKQDMDILAALEEMQSMRSRHAGVTVDQMLEILKRSAHEKVISYIPSHELAKSVRFRGSTGHVKRIEEDEDEEDFFEACLAKAVANRQAHGKQGQTTSPLANVPKRRRMPVAADGKAQGDLAETPEVSSASAAEGKPSSGALQVLCCSYGDGSDDDKS